jgi:hypothetical protein
MFSLFHFPRRRYEEANEFMDNFHSASVASRAGASWLFPDLHQ